MTTGVLYKENNKLMFLPFDERKLVDLSDFNKEMVCKDREGIYTLQVPEEYEFKLKVDAFERRLIVDGFYKADYKYFKREVHVQNIERRRTKMKEKKS